MVSIIVPVYKCECTVSKCIESILAQTYTDIEVLLIDDGTPDSSGLICDEYAKKEPRIRVIHQENRGVSATRNRGIELAKGEYIQFVDSDDYIAVDMVEKLVKAIEMNQTDCVICGRTELKDDDEVRIKGVDAAKVAITNMYRECPQLFQDYLINSPWNKLFKREFISTLYDSTLSLGEDLLFNLEYFRNIQTVSFIKDSLYYYVIQESGLARRFRREQLQVAERIYEESLRFIQENNMGKAAEADVATIFMRRIFYGSYELFVCKELTTKEKKDMVSYWMNRESIHNALGNCRWSTRVQRIFGRLLQSKKLHLVIGFLTLKKWARNR